ncbi:MAG: hypothetical protein ACYTEQ_25940 [Planctomycetota bacterium]|jgi:hypothetical protein
MKLITAFFITFIIGFALGVGWGGVLWYKSKPAVLLDVSVQKARR